MGLCDVIGDFSVDNSNYNRLKSEKFVNSKLKINIKRKKKYEQNLTHKVCTIHNNHQT